jgi:hypothetical protein
MKTENGLGSYFGNSKISCGGFKLSKVFLVLLILCLQANQTSEAQQPMNYTIQANIIYRFTKYIDWPGTGKTGDFVIGVVGDSPLSNELKSFVVNKTVGGQKIIVKKFSPSATTFDCQILFISEDESRSLKRIAARTGGTAILIVSESEGLALQGACINFVIVSDHLKLEINKGNIERRSMSIASELLQIGIVVK